jgi:hypothetical protein
MWHITSDLLDEWDRDCELWRGRKLRGQFSHWCYDWDGLPVDETTEEWECCNDCRPFCLDGERPKSALSHTPKERDR